jgi:FOG: Glucan-binding domain (YG repeat)
MVRRGGFGMKGFIRITGNFILSLTVLAEMPLTANAEWRQNNNVWWYSQGQSYATNWAKIDGQWYYFDFNGYMKTGWIKDNGNWYYLYENGTMAYATTIDGYYINSNGIATSEQTSASSGTLSCH